MSALLRQYFDIAFLMRGPQALPGGEAQMRLGVALAFAATFVAALAFGYEPSRALLLTALDIGITGAVLRVALGLAGRAERFEQAFGGYCGAVAFVNAAATPIYLGQDSLAGAGAGYPSFADFVLLMWNLSLLGHVVRHAFEVRLATSILIAFAYVVALSTVVHSVLPDSPAVAVTEPGEVSRIDGGGLYGEAHGGAGGTADSRFSVADRSPGASDPVL